MVFFHGYDIPYVDLVRSKLIELAEKHGFSVHKLSYSFLNQAEMLALNQSALNHDTHTDIITFDYTVNQMLSADIYISTASFQENAAKYNVSAEHELTRLLAHGLLHCLGFNDKTEEDKRQMRLAEDQFLNCFTWNT